MHPGEARTYIAVVSGLFVLITLMTFFVITIARYQRKKVALSRRQITEHFTCIDKERERTASDLHDGLGASLSAIKLQLQLFKNLDAGNEMIASKSQQRIDEAIVKLKDISFNMMPGILQRRGLNAALKELVDIMTYPTPIHVNYKNKVDFPDKARAIHIYRMAQEIMTNIIRHSQATMIDFTMTEQKKMILLHISDNGRGFDRDMVLEKTSGSGLQNIMARADILKAKIFLTAKEGEGVDYLIKIPPDGNSKNKSDNSRRS